MRTDIRTIFPIDCLRKTESGDYTNLALLIKKEFAPENLKRRYDKFFDPENERNIIDQEAADSLEKLEYQPIPAQETHEENIYVEQEAVFYQDAYGHKFPFSKRLILFFKKYIKNFSLHFDDCAYYDYGHKPTAAIYSGENIAGFILPLRT